MFTTHNKIDKAIEAMEEVVAKGQPFAKANKDRRIREILRWMRIEQERPVLLKEVWFYFKRWLFKTPSSLPGALPEEGSNKEQEVSNGEQSR